MPPFPLNKANSIINKLFNLSFYWGTLKPNFNGVQWSRSWCSFKVILRPAKVFPSSPEKSPFLLRCQKSDQSCQIKTNRNYLGKKLRGVSLAAQVARNGSKRSFPTFLLQLFLIHWCFFSRLAGISWSPREAVWLLGPRMNAGGRGRRWQQPTLRKRDLE